MVRGASRPGSPFPPPLPLEFYAASAAEIARSLLGCFLLAESGGQRVGGRIVETEAYTGPEDPACHAAARIGRTARNDPLYGPPGTAYVHLNYGVHWCLNAVTGPIGHPAAVLIRALEPTVGCDTMRRRRGREDLTNGPARLTQALAIGPGLQRHPLDRPPLWISPGEPIPLASLVVTRRVGISRGVDLPLRFYDGRSRWVSRR
ncbi:MAG: DNA-3-methyladenine glycosylase [Gemmatimonadota bacterium]